MKYILITMLLVSGSIYAESFSMAEYAARTGKLPAKVIKTTNSFAEKVASTQNAIFKLEAKREALKSKVPGINRQYSDQMGKLSKMEGDLTKSRKAAMMARTTRLFTFSQEIARVGKRLGELREMLEYYEGMVKSEIIGKRLRVRGLISSIS